LSRTPAPGTAPERPPAGRPDPRCWPGSGADAPVHPGPCFPPGFWPGWFLYSLGSSCHLHSDNKFYWHPYHSTAKRTCQQILQSFIGRIFRTQDFARFVCRLRPLFVPAQAKRKPPRFTPQGFRFSRSRHLPIFTGRVQPTIFGTSELNFCVRNRNRLGLTVIDTGRPDLVYTFLCRLSRRVSILF